MKSILSGKGVNTPRVERHPVLRDTYRVVTRSSVLFDHLSERDACLIANAHENFEELQRLQYALGQTHENVSKRIGYNFPHIGT